jgi:predicted nucleic acid-binding protein
VIYADTDFFLALLKPTDWLRKKAKKILEENKGNITTSEATFIELMLLAKKYNLEYIRIATNVMIICRIEEQTYLKAAMYITDGVGIFDAFHAAHCKEEIISSDSVYDKLGLKRIKLLLTT